MSELHRPRFRVPSERDIQLAIRVERAINFVFAFGCVSLIALAVRRIVAVF